MRRTICALGCLGALLALAVGVLGQTVCKTPPFITGGVSANVMVIFDTSGSMASILWVDEFDPLTDYSGPLLPLGKTVVFAASTDCLPDHHRVTFQTDEGKIKLRYRNYTSRDNICSGTEDRETQWSEADSHFYFDRNTGDFIEKEDYIDGDPNHVKIFLPYATYSVDVDDDGDKSTWYNYNYLNWIFYHSTPAERDAVKAMHDDPAQRDLLTRILAAKKAVKDAVAANQDMRIGLMKFDETKGGEIVAPIPSDIDTLHAAIDRLSAGGGTPLAETLEDVWDYFSDPDESPIEYWCQKNFVILMTDGLPTWDANDLSSYIKKDWDGDSGGSSPDWEGDETNRYPGEGSDYLDDIAYYMYHNDASNLEGIQNVSTFTIGFIIHKPLLLNTAFNGHGVQGREAEWNDPTSPLYRKYFYTTRNREGLRESLSQALREISMSISSGTSVAVLSTATGTEDLLFRASFHPIGWKGFLEAFEVKGSQVTLGAPRWEAGEILRNTAPADRRIYTALKSATGVDEKLDFIEANVAATDDEGQQLFKLLGTTNANDGRDIIRFIRGDDVVGFRDRNGYKLGDIINSTPVVVGPPDGYSNDPTYIEFRRQNVLRERMLYVGANDGMVHAFHVDEPRGGQEAWSFIPNNLLSRLKDLTDQDYDFCHGYFVDLPPTVADVFIDPDGAGIGPEPRQWRTLLIGGEREGGKAYFALDVTHPSADQFRPIWEFSDLRLGESWSIPAIGKTIDSEGEDRWLAFVGNGFNNDDGKGYLFALDLETGENFREPLALGAGSTNVLTSPVAVDINGDDYADSLFSGDLSGKVWRFNITDQTMSPKTYHPLNPDEWQPQEIFQTLPEQPVTLPVGLSFYCSGPTDQECSNLFTYFGTGKYLTLDDKEDKSLQSFYAVKDEFAGLTRDDVDMKNRTTSGDCETVPDPDKIKGWYVDLTTEGERVSSPPLVGGGLVFFLTFVPDVGDPCSVGGTTYLYYREFDTGCVPNQTVFGEDPDPEGEERPSGRILIGAGYATEMFYYAKTEEMLIQTSDRTVHSRKVSLPRGGIENYAWREVFY